MLKFDSSDQTARIRTHRGTRVFMASHPEIRPYFRSRSRPTEFGDRVWEMTLRLMPVLEEIKADHALELGCGWGLAGIHFARVSGATVICTDVDPNLEPIVKKQATLNAVPVEFQTVSFGDLSEKNLKRDLIFGCEVCYCAEVRRDLCQLIDRAAESGAGQLLIADPGRPDFEDLFAFGKNRHGATLSDIRRPGETKTAYLMTIRF